MLKHKIMLQYIKHYAEGFYTFVHCIIARSSSAGFWDGQFADTRLGQGLA